MEKAGSAGALERVAELRSRERRLFTLQIVGFTYRELSELTDDSVRTVDRQLGRTHERIRSGRR